MVDVLRDGSGGMAWGAEQARAARIARIWALATAVVAAEATAATFTINSTADLADANGADGICQTGTPGQCTLRAAIQQANALAGPHVINFAIPGTGLRTIAPATPLPQIVRQVDINGYSQPGASANTSATGSNAVLLIELSGQNAGTGGQGLVFAGGSSGSSVSGLIVNRFVSAGGLGAAIDIATSSVTVRGNWIGLAADGRTALPNGFGVRTLNSAVQFTAVGGVLPADRNVISGNRVDGLRLCGGLHQVRGNIVGLGADGDSVVDNGDGWSQRIGVYVDDCTGTTTGAGAVTVGGTSPGARNVISGNGANVFLESGANLVTNAYIGLNAAGTAARAPRLDCGAGIEIGRSGCDTAAFSTATGNMVGGPTAVQRVLIAGNPGAGVVDEGTSTLVRGSWFGLAADGVTVVPNAGTGLTTRGVGAILGGAAAGEGNVFAGAGVGTAVLVDTAANGTVVRGNWIGLTSNGGAAGSSFGLHLAGANATVGGTAAGARNVISGHSAHGIVIDYTVGGTITIEGNFIGTTTSGTAALSPGVSTRQNGILAWLYDDNGFSTPGGTMVIGGVTPGAGNVIAGNIVGVSYTGGCGVRLLMRGNRVGVGVGGEIVPNLSHGVAVQGCMGGGSVVDAGNTIANNGGDGIRLLGTAGVGGVPVVGLQNNLVSDNSGLGINLVPTGAPPSEAVTPNDGGDADAGPNGLLNFPVITRRIGFGAYWQLEGSYSGPPSTEVSLNFYANAGCDASGHGEGQQPIGVNTYRTDAQGRMNFIYTYPQSSAPGLDAITATATVGNATSEFSPCAADLRLTLGDDPDPVDAGQPVTYAMTVVNLSSVFPSNAGRVYVGLPEGVNVIAAPGGTRVPLGRLSSGYRYVLPPLPPGGSAQFSIQMAHTVAGTVAVRSWHEGAFDLDPTNNEATITTTVTIVLSGRVTSAATGQGLAGATVTLSGSQTATATTTADGGYRFTGLAAGATTGYTVTASLARYTFEPASRTFSAPAANQTGDFLGARTYTLGGQVRDLNGTGVGGVTITVSGSSTGTRTTDLDGRYGVTAVEGGTYTVTPSKGAFVFEPASRTFPTVARDEGAGDYIVQSGQFTRYFAEGATGPFFDTRFAVLNVTGRPATVLMRFQRPAPAPEVTSSFHLGGQQRITVDPEALGLAQAEFSTVIESDQPVVADRLMAWDATAYGSHAETSVGRPLTQWFLAEGATIGGFDLFYLLQNPADTQARVEVRYLLPAPRAPLVKTYDVAPRSRFNIWVNLEDPVLADAEVSAAITSLNGVPIIVERAMYLGVGGQMFGAGHESAGVGAPAAEWFFGEGATGAFFDLFFLIANPNADPSRVEARYLKPDGSVVTRAYDVAGNSRFNIWVDTEGPELADTAVATTFRVLNGVPVVIERAMWWPGSGWQEGHDAAGATQTGEKWALAEGELGGATRIETYVLIGNMSDREGTARVTLTLEDGRQPVREFRLLPSSRTNVAVGAEFPEAAGTRFGVVVESVGPAPVQLVVERATYNDSGGMGWAAGTSALGTKLR